MSVLKAENPGKKLDAMNKIIESLRVLSEMETCMNELWLASEDCSGSLLSSVLLILKLERLGKIVETVRSPGQCQLSVQSIKVFITGRSE